MVTFTTLVYLTALILSVITFPLAIYVICYRLFTLRSLPIALRLYLTFCFFPVIVSLTFLTSALEIYYFVAAVPSALVNEIINYFLAFSCQSIRNVFFSIILERIVATVYWETYTMAHKKSMFWCLTGFSFFLTILYMCFVGYNRLSTVASFLQIITYYVLIVHSFTLLMCLALLYLNKKMYKLTAYRINLKKRHQILQNVKVLSFLLPSILIHTLITPSTSVISLVINFLKLPAVPSTFMHISYVLPLLLICLRHVRMSAKDTEPMNGVQIVKDAMGNALPTVFTTDNYFHELQNRWK